MKCKLYAERGKEMRVSIKNKEILRLELPMRLKNKYRASNCIREELVITEKDNQKLS